MNNHSNSAMITTGARVCLCVALAVLACAVFGAIPAAPPELAVAKSRYIYLPPVDDGGLSSGPHAITICLPAGYDATDRRYPVFYILDGEGAFMNRQNGMGNPTYDLAHDQLVQDGLIEPAILVAIDNSVDADGNGIPGNRGNDYSPPGRTYTQGNVVKQAGTGYYEYLAKTIKPMIDTTYRTRPEAASTGVAGFSASGYGAFWMAFLHPETFGMGICQSPQLWPVQNILDDHTGPLPATRLWIDIGSRELGKIGLWEGVWLTCQKLTAKGFRLNDNLGFQMKHNAGHGTTGLRSALYFMLRTKTPQLTGVEINEMDAGYNETIRLARLGHVILEPVYDNWFRLTDCTAAFTVADPAIATLGDPSCNEMRPVAVGNTTISTSYEGRKIVRQITVSAPTAQQPCIATKTPIAIDGNLSDWPTLPLLVDKPQSADESLAWRGADDLSYRFGCTFDDQYFYVAIQATDQYLNSVPDKDPWFQDGIEVRIDARPESARLFGQGRNEFTDILLVATSPARAGETHAPYSAAKLPVGTRVICVATPTGHNTEMAIPISYLNTMAGQPWRGVRLNVVVNDLDDDFKGFQGDKLWWQPDWRSPDSTWGSGTFVKQ